MNKGEPRLASKLLVAHVYLRSLQVGCLFLVFVFNLRGSKSLNKTKVAVLISPVLQHFQKKISQTISLFPGNLAEEKEKLNIVLTDWHKTLIAIFNKCKSRILHQTASFKICDLSYYNTSNLFLFTFAWHTQKAIPVYNYWQGDMGRHDAC